MTKRKGQYSQWTKLAALAELDRNGHNYYQTEKATGIRASTLRRWENQMRAQVHKEAADSDELAEEASPEQHWDNLADQLIAALPEKLEDANLHQTIEAIKFVQAKVDQAESSGSASVYEKLARLMDRYAAEKRAADAAESTDGERGG